MRGRNIWSYRAGDGKGWKKVNGGREEWERAKMTQKGEVRDDHPKVMGRGEQPVRESLRGGNELQPTRMDIFSLPSN